MDPTAPSYVYAATLDRVIDGDTFVLNVDLGFRINTHFKFRLLGVDAPELDTEEGKRAKTFAIDELSPRPLLVRTYKERRSFDRWVAEVFFESADGFYHSFSEHLIEQGHAVRMAPR